MEVGEPDLRGLDPIGLDLRSLEFWYSFWYSLAPSELVSTWDCNELQMEARVGIGLGKADFECKNSLILLMIQHFCETIFTDSFTMVC